MSASHQENLEVMHAREAERSIVAALFSDNTDAAMEAFDRITLILTAEDFYFSAYRMVYTAFGILVEENQRPDAVMLSTYLKSAEGYSEEVRKTLVDAGSAQFSLENMEAYATAVAEKAKARRLQSELHALIKKMPRVGAGISSADVLREMDAVAMGFDDQATSDKQLLDGPMELVKRTIERLDAVQDGVFVGARTGIDKLDEKLGALLPGDLIIIAGRPSMGKTAFALDIVLENNVRTEVPEDEKKIAAIFSMEMEREKLGNRMLANIGGINHDHVRKSNLADDEWTRLIHATDRYLKSCIYDDCSSTLTPATLRSKCRLLVRHTKKKLGLIVVDYLQLMDVDGDSGRKLDRNAEITIISRSLKKLAKEFGCPVIALSQLNRGVEQRSDKRPVMSDLRESGAIEQDADVILLLYRDEYYNPDSPDKGLVEIIAAKARDGGVGPVAAQFIGEYQRFRNINTSAYSYD